MTLKDKLQRPLRDLRISVTDRCNFRCTYCMPGDRTYAFLPRKDILSLEEIARVAAICVRFGVEKLRLTGGEPLLRRNLCELVRQLAAIEGVEDIALTTNGFLLEKWAGPLAEAGLHRVTVSLDSLVPATFSKLSGSKVSPEQVLAGMAAAAASGMPVKVNAVVQRGVNEDQIPLLSELCRSRGYTLRFIEFMDVGNVNNWQHQRVVPATEILERVAAVCPLEPLEPAYPGEVANRFRYRDGNGELGVIASVTRPFCQTCNRARLSADGHLYTCLFTHLGHDIKTPLREQGEEAVARLLQKVWGGRSDRYSEQRAEGDGKRDKVEMFHIGG